MQHTYSNLLFLLATSNPPILIFMLTVVLVEAFVIRFFTASSWLRAIPTSLLMNVVSGFAAAIMLAYIGNKLYEGSLKDNLLVLAFILALILYSLFYVFRYRSFFVPLTGLFCMIIGIIALSVLLRIDASWGYADLPYSGCLSRLLQIIAYFFSGFGMTIAIEIWVARMFYRHREIDIAVLYANLYSLLALIYVLAGYVLLKMYFM